MNQENKDNRSEIGGSFHPANLGEALMRVTILIAVRSLLDAGGNRDKALINAVDEVSRLRGLILTKAQEQIIKMPDAVLNELMASGMKAFSDGIAQPKQP